MTYSPSFTGSTGAASKVIQTTFTSGTGLTLSKATPVSINASSQIIAIDVSSETSVYRLVGLCGADIAGAATGNVVDTGRLENVILGYSVGDPLYVSKSGFLTNVKPDIGVGGFLSGDWVIFVGLLIKNDSDPLKKDIKLMLSIVGQL
jgi:hypothetical protein